MKEQPRRAQSQLPQQETLLSEAMRKTLDKTFDIVVWGHSDQSGGAELACELFLRFRELYKGLGEHVVIVCSGDAEESVRRRLFATLGFHINCIITVEKSLSIVKTSGSVDPIETEKELLAKFGTPGALQALMRHHEEKVAPHIHLKTLLVSCGEPLAVAFAKDRGLRCIIMTDILMPDAVRFVLEYGGRLSPEAARALTTLSNFDREADEAYLAPPEMCGTSYDAYFADQGVRAQSLGGLFYEPLNGIATDERRNPHLRKLLEAAGDDRVVFVFGGGGQVFLELYERLANELRQDRSRAPFAVLLPRVERTPGDPNKLRRVTDSGVYLYTLFRTNMTEETLGDPGSLAFWYAGCDLVVGRGGLVAQQVLAMMLAEDPPARPFMLFIEETGHPQIEQERRALYRMGFVISSTFDAFRRAPFSEIDRAIATKTPKSTEIMRLRVQARYGINCLDHAISAIIKTYL